MQFKGNYSAFTAGDNNIYYMAASAEAARSVILNFGEGEASGIDDLRIDDLRLGRWYTVDGLKLDKQPTRKGLYIQGGRKFR